MLDRKRIKHNLHMMCVNGKITRQQLEYILKAGEDDSKKVKEHCEFSG